MLLKIPESKKIVILKSLFLFHYLLLHVGHQSLQLLKTTKLKLLDLNESVNKSQKMVDDMLKGNVSKSSFYVNAIIQNLPSTILLLELNYQPLLKRIKSEQPVMIDNHTLLLAGVSNNSAFFSKWIMDMEAIDWIQKVEILHYEDASTSISSFGLKLIMTHD